MNFTQAVIRRVSGFYYFILTVTGLAVMGLILLFYFSTRDLPKVPEPLSRIIETPPTEILSSAGKSLYILGGRESVPLERVSRHFIKAVISIEDRRFWEHHGIDKLRTIKALYITLFKPGKVEGASTITQQLSKNLFFSFKKSYLRKFHELMIAFQIEANSSKQEILEAYLNQIPFGIGAFGVEQASRKFFGKPASQLTLSESALLAGIPKSPTRYNPFYHFERAKKRQELVLRSMVAASAITQEEADLAISEPLRLTPGIPVGNRSGSYFLDSVIRELEQKYGPDVVYHGGLRIRTTLDTNFQRIAEEVVQNGLKQLDSITGDSGDKKNGAPVLQGALVTIDTNSGAVLSMVGGRNYLETEFNRAMKSSRQPGSGFKPFLYYTAFDKLGLNPSTVYTDKPVTIPIRGSADWKVSNFGKTHEGPMVLKYALKKSVNTVAAQLVNDTTAGSVIDTARKCGITSPLKPFLSVALGSIGVSPLEMASAYSTLATSGVRHEPYIISRVEDIKGRIIYEHILSRKRVLDKTITFQVVDMMRAVVDTGTGSVARRMGFKHPAAGKTGTSNDYNDAWFTGFTPSLSTSVWVGYDKRKKIKDKNGVGITGGRGAAPIWADFMIKATDGDPMRDFVIPEDIKFEMINIKTGCKPSGNTETTLRTALQKNVNLCTDIENTPTVDIPIDDIPTDDIPTEDTPTEDTPTEDTPIEDTPIEDTPIEDTPIENAPIEDTPKEDTQDLNEQVIIN